MISKTVKMMMLIFVGVIICLLSRDVRAAKYEYDALHRLTRVIYDANTSIEYSYDAVGNRTRYVSNVAMKPEIKVFYNGVEVINGQSNLIDFGSVHKGTMGPSKTFTIRNEGNAKLLLSVPFTDLPHFIVGEPSKTELNAGEKTTFTVSLKTIEEGSFNEQVLFDNNDADENPFNFSVFGNVRAASQPTISKCTVTAGKGVNEDKDSITFSGTIGVMPTDFSGASEIIVNIGGVYSEAISVSSFKIKKGKYTYTHKIPKGAAGAITSLVIDTNKNKFSLKAKKVDLTGLHCPIEVEFEIGNYWGVCEVDESIVNGKKFIPVQLMTGVEDYLQVQSVKVKKGKSTDTLTIKGGIAFKNLPSSMSDVVLTLEGQTFTIPIGSFKQSGKSGLKYVCKNAKVTESGIATATFDFGKCTFKIIIKNTTVGITSGKVDLILTMGSFNEQVNFDLGG